MSADSGSGSSDSVSGRGSAPTCQVRACVSGMACVMESCRPMVGATVCVGLRLRFVCQRSEGRRSGASPKDKRRNLALFCEEGG